MFPSDHHSITGIITSDFLSLAISIIPQTVLALRGPGGVGESSGLLLRFHAGAPPPGKPLAASPWAARGRWQPGAVTIEN